MRLHEEPENALRGSESIRDSACELKGATFKATTSIAKTRCPASARDVHKRKESLQLDRRFSDFVHLNPALSALKDLE